MIRIRNTARKSTFFFFFGFYCLILKAWPGRLGAPGEINECECNVKQNQNHFRGPPNITSQNSSWTDSSSSLTWTRPISLETTKVEFENTRCCPSPTGGQRPSTSNSGNSIYKGNKASRSTHSLFPTKINKLIYKPQNLKRYKIGKFLVQVPVLWPRG